MPVRRAISEGIPLEEATMLDEVPHFRVVGGVLEDIGLRPVFAV